MMKRQPLIFDMHRFALDDGPGIRTTVFFKGCHLNCSWCHNPESIRAEPEIAYFQDKCILCDACVGSCPEAAITPAVFQRIDRRHCRSCGACADACPTTALKMLGKSYSTDELLALLLRDRRSFEISGGGVTFSGGEPTLAMDYLSEALQAVQAEQLHTAIQTSGMFDYDEFAAKILPYTDLIMYDLKLYDSRQHRRFAGRNNGVILKNFELLTRDASAKLLPRVPLIPGITATRINLLNIASFLAELGHKECVLLPYHQLDIEKRRAIGQGCNQDFLDARLGIEEEQLLREIFNERLSRGNGSISPPPPPPLF